MMGDPLFLLIVGSILIFLLIGLIGNWQLGSRLQQLLRSIKLYGIRVQDWERIPPSEEFLMEMLEEYRAQKLAGIDVLNSQALIERQFSRLKVRVIGIFPISAGGWDRFISFLSAAMVMLGLLGTFIGLTSALFGMQRVLGGIGITTTDVSVHEIIKAISQPFDGMSVAFITSIIGIGSSLILSAFTSGLFGKVLGPNIQQLRAELYSECEDFLDNHYLLYVESLKPKGSMDVILDTLVERVKESFQESVAAFGESIIHMTGRIGQSVEGIHQLIERQEKMLGAFDHGTDQLVRFGQIMESTILTLVENHKDTASQTERLGLQVEHLHKSIDSLSVKTLDSSRSLEAVFRSLSQTLEDERKNIEKMIQLTSEIQERSKEQWEQLRREWANLIELEQRREQEIREQTIRQLEQVFQRMDQGMLQQFRTIVQNLQQAFAEMGRLIRERLPSISRSAEEFSRSIENMDRLFADFLERFRREISALISQNQEKERKYLAQSDANREIREVTREIESVRGLLEREFHQSHRFAYEIQQLIEAIYETGRRSLRRSEPKGVENKPYPVNRNEREYFENGRPRDW